MNASISSLLSTPFADWLLKSSTSRREASSKPTSLHLLMDNPVTHLSSCLRTVLAAIADPVFITTLEGEIQVTNQAANTLLGYCPEELVGRSIHWLSPEDLLVTAAEFAALQTEQAINHLPKHLMTQSGQTLPILLSCALHGEEQSNPLGIIWIVQEQRQPDRIDIAPNQQADATLKRYQLLSQHTRDIVLFLRPNGQIVDANNAALQAYDYEREDLLALTFFDLHDGSSIALVHDQMTQVNQQDLLFEATHRRQDNSLFAVEVSIQAAVIDEEPVLVSIIRDITNRKRAEEKLFRSAFHDALTNLPNRALFLERLRHALQQAKRQETFRFAVLFLDLDRFKVINDSLGHLAGDQLLVAIAQRLSACLRPEDTLARFGGDEFTILLEAIAGLDEATQIAAQIQQELSQPFKLLGQDIYTSTSIGIVLSTLNWRMPEEFVRSADTALYRSKALGGNRYVVFDAEMHHQALNRLHLETDLQRAVGDERPGMIIPLEPSALASHPEFEVFYQPIVSLKTQRISGFEALLRWRHPERGLVSPAEFIPIAEETGLIIPIGWIALRQACWQAHLWQTQFPSHPPLWISVNLSVKQFSQLNLVAQIRQTLEATGLSPASLKLEVTESALMENPETAADMMRELHDLGVQLSLDDFGTGYSSLAYLHRFPIDTLKIDRSFIQRVDSDGEQLEIVRTIVTLAWNIGMDVVAEGVETNRQLAQLRAVRCEYGQGFLFSKAVPAADATELLTKIVL